MELTQASRAKTFAETFPESVADIMIGLYGSQALAAARDFGLTAFADRRHDDCLSWLAVYDRLLERGERPEDGGD